VKVFIAGATGVLGRRLTQQFRRRGHIVMCLARNANNESAIRALGGEPRRSDLFDVDSLAAAAVGADVIVHAATAIPTAAKVKPQDWEMNDRIRRSGTRALAETAGRIGAEALLVQSITWVARPADQSAFDENSPLQPDAVTQSAADMETIAQEAGERQGFRTTILRCGWFYAPDAGHTRSFGELLMKRQLPVIGQGDAIWSWLHVYDAASAFVTAAEANKGGVWHVVDDQPVTAAEYLDTFARRLGAPAPRHVPTWLARILAGSFAVNFMASSTRTSNARFKRDFAWKPRFPSYREGLDDVLAAWQDENFLGLTRRSAA